MGQFCGPSGCYLPQPSVFYGPEYHLPPIVSPSIAEEYKMADMNGKWFLHRDPAYLQRWIESRNLMIRTDAKKKAEAAKKPVVKKVALPPQDSVPPSMNFGIQAQQLNQSAPSGLKTNDPEIAKAILPAVDPDAGKEVPIPDAKNSPIRIDYQATAAVVAIAVALCLFVIGITIK
jgi:hypothetical protein